MGSFQPWDAWGDAIIPTMRPQVDGSYEDWVEVLRLIYHSGGFRPLCSHTCGACMFKRPHEHICLIPL